MICEKCGEQLDDDAKFCPKCGSQTVLSEKGNQNQSQYLREGQNVSSLNKDDLIHKQKNTTQRFAVTALILFLIACAIIIVGILGSKTGYDIRSTEQATESAEDSLDIGNNEGVVSDKTDTIIENKAESQEVADEILSENEARVALEKIDALMSNYIWVILMAEQFDHPGDIVNSLPVNLTDAEKIRASVLASNSDCKIDDYFTLQNNSLELFEGSQDVDIEIYHGVSVARDSVEKNCENLFGTNANWDSLQTTIKNTIFDAANLYVKNEMHAMQLSLDIETESDQESHKYRIKKSENGYKGEVELFLGYWGELQANPGYSNYMVTYELVPCSSSEYGVAISSMNISWIGEQHIDKNSTQAEQNTPFYGVWCFGSKNENDALAFVETLSASGIAGNVFVSNEWSNLNKDKFYVVSVGIYPTEEQAKDALKTVKEQGYSSAYVKYSGNYLGNN